MCLCDYLRNDTMKIRILCILLFLLYGVTGLNARNDSSEVTVPRIAVKLNAPIVVGIVNPAIEFSLNQHFTINTEIFGCFYPQGFAFINKRAEMALAFVEARWYPAYSFKGFFVGPNLGYGVWQLSKSLIPEFEKEYKDRYQVGSNFMCGITLGYMFRFSEHWGMELSVGGGYSIAHYEGHVNLDGSMFVGYNGSSEWIPYKAALSVVYKW